MERSNVQLNLRHAEAEHLLDALSRLPKDESNNVVHTSLVKTLTSIKQEWEEQEKLRKAKFKARQNRNLKRRGNGTKQSTKR